MSGEGDEKPAEQNTSQTQSTDHISLKVVDQVRLGACIDHR